MDLPASSVAFPTTGWLDPSTPFARESKALGTFLPFLQKTVNNSYRLKRTFRRPHAIRFLTRRLAFRASMPIYSLLYAWQNQRSRLRSVKFQTPVASGADPRLYQTQLEPASSRTPTACFSLLGAMRYRHTHDDPMAWAASPFDDVTAWVGLLEGFRGH